MTVHGAKGLQAPVVFIVEKFKTRSRVDRLLWELNEAREGQFMLMRPSSDTDTSYTSHLKAKAEQLESQEDKRLFYVALTRAQDYLYLTGYGDNEIPENSWYQWLQADAQVTDIGNEMTPYQAVEQHQIKTKNWLLNPVRHRKLAPVIQEEKTQVQTIAMERGVLIHRLFELLFDLPDTVREKAAKSYLQKHNINNIDIPLAAILDVLSSETLSAFSQGQAIAEMEMVAEDGKVMRLDRVIVTEKVIKILDFKTSENIPKAVSTTPGAILTQLADYATTITTVYPKHRVECYLLWTAGPILHYIPEILLKEKSSLSYQS